MKSFEGGDTNWMRKSACLSEEPELFFPEKSSTRQVEEAKAVCARCEVVKKCGEYALANQMPHGVWGGLDEDERMKKAARIRVSKNPRRSA